MKNATTWQCTARTDDFSAIELIREIKLLRVLFHLMLLSIMNTSESYYD